MRVDVLPDAAGTRLDHFLAAKFPDLSRSRIKKLIEDGFLRVGEEVARKCGLKLKGGESFELTLPDAEPLQAIPEELPLSILYEDQDVIVIDKAAGMVVHPAAGHFGGTLVNALLFHCKDLSGIGGKLRPGIVHRLDKDTSGVMIVTKNDEAHHKLAGQFKAHSISRKYKALVFGTMEQEGTVDLPLGRHPRDRKKIAVAQSGRRAVTHWSVLRAYRGVNFVELELETGRTHQIRVHLSNMAHPVIGDPVYGNPKRALEIASTSVRNKIKALGRQALHAYFLTFKHPRTDKEMEFESPLPGDMQELIDLLEAEA